MFSRSDLDELVAMEVQPAVSLYLPTHAAGREIRQDPVRLKNLLTSAVERLGTGCRSVEIDRLLAPARRLIDDGEFWRHQQRGLAIFLAPGFERIHRFPISVPEETVIGSHFHIKPLLPLFDDAGPFWLLSITASHSRLYRGSRWDFAECAGLDLPQGIAAVGSETEYQETQYASPTGRHGALAHAQSFGEAPDELRKTELVELLHRIAAAVEPHVNRQAAPIILAAHPEIQGHFRQIAGWREIQAEGISENPDALTRDELHRRAYALVEPKLAEARAAALERLNTLLAAGKATSRPEEIVKAARYARVETLFLNNDEHLWGTLDETADKGVTHGRAAEDDVDLLDYAALMTLRHGGAVVLVAPTDLPPPSLAAAILRY